MKGSLRQGPTFHTISFGLRFHNEETKVCTNERAVTREGQRQHGLSERAAVDGARVQPMLRHVENGRRAMSTTATAGTTATAPA